MEVIRVHSGETFEEVYLNEPSVNLRIVQEAGSSVKIHVLNMPFKQAEGANLQTISNTISVDQAGSGCSTEIYALAYLHNDESVTTETHVTHTVGGGTSNQLIKFVLDNQAKGHFVGDLKIVQDAQHTEAHQTNRNLLLSDDAQMRTQPQLEIYADDVQATHGASTGQLDESALFYMQQRGIGKQKARQLLVNAFMKDVVETISDERLREQLLDSIDGVIE